MIRAPILVTGAAGFAGQHLLRALDASQPGGHASQLIGWHRPGAPPLMPPLAGVEWQGVDLLDRHGVLRAIADAGPAQLYHLAGAPHVGESWRDSLPSLQINALGTHHVLDAVRIAAPRCRVLVVTSATVYRPSDVALDEEAPLVPSSPYGLSKLAQDELARRVAEDDGMDVAIVRPFNHFGPGQKATFAASGFARQIARIEAGLDAPRLYVGNLEARRDLTDVRDVVEAYITLMGAARAGRPYNVCSGRAWRIGDLLEMLLGMTSARIDVKSDLARLRPSDVPVLLGAAGRISTELGWRAHRTIEQTLADTLDWWRGRVAYEAAGG